ncbi:hypothetical protein TWF481_002759 [Arthrobotrys musiformis]|uniref:Uncharacterized protein n=1 Tax=Arthrobotrys musiformis TaxID=47236 RepID=A0AAV9VU20_9PEZI
MKMSADEEYESENEGYEEIAQNDTTPGPNLGWQQVLARIEMEEEAFGEDEETGEPEVGEKKDVEFGYVAKVVESTNVSFVPIYDRDLL